MHRKHPIRLAGAALVAATLVALAAPAPAHAVDYDDIDTVKLTDPQVDFGSDDWSGLFNDPLGSARVYWDVEDGHSTPEIVGWLHMHKAAEHWGRLYVEYY